MKTGRQNNLVNLHYPAINFSCATILATAAISFFCQTIACANPDAGSLILAAPQTSRDSARKQLEASEASRTDAHSKKVDTATWCTARTVIKATPEVVWRTVHEERNNDPDISYTRVLEQTSEHDYKLEQKFCFLPVLGTAVCVTQHTEVPYERIDYKLLKSDHFKAMDGNWTFEPTDGGKSTILQLTSRLDLGLPVPKMFMNSISTKKMERRLAHIKKLAEESPRTSMAVHGEHLGHY